MRLQEKKEPVMVGGWLAKGLLVFLLTFAFVGLAHGQTKSADLPVQQRVVCVPALAIPADLFGSDMPASSMSPSLAILVSDFPTTEFRIEIFTDNGLPEMGILPWVAKTLLETPAQTAMLFANPIGQLIGLFY
jgi:hypothetical protein